MLLLMILLVVVGVGVGVLVLGNWDDGTVRSNVICSAPLGDVDGEWSGDVTGETKLGVDTGATICNVAPLL